ncbi:MAG: MBOAT family O-acyltransferase [Thiohalocapsa sp.]
MSLVAPSFLLVALAAVLLLRVPRLRARRADILAALSLVFALLATATPRDGMCLLAMAVSGRLLLSAVAASRSARLLALAILCIIGEFLLSRWLAPGTLWLPGVELGRTLGLSYVMFRILHLLVDAQGGELPDQLRWRDYLCYLFFFPTFLAGPIQRLQDFAAELARPTAPLSIPERRADLQRIIAGLFKFTVLAAAAFAVFRWAGGAAATSSAPRMAAAFVAFGVYLYLSFAGYTDIVRGVGGLCDVQLPQNFARPWLSANFLDLWSRWHISLSDWFKLYVFNPAVKALLSRFDRPALVPYLGAVGYFLTFFLMGLWHGTSLRFAFYGLALGAGVSINKLFQVAMTARFGRRSYAAMTKRPVYSAFSGAAAVGYFVLALGFFWLPAPAAIAVGPLAVAAALVFATILIGTAVDAATQARLPTLLPSRFEAPVYALMLGASVVLVWLDPGAVPPLLYQFF